MQQSFNDDVKRRESPKKKEDTMDAHSSTSIIYFLFICFVYLFFDFASGRWIQLDR